MKRIAQLGAACLCLAGMWLYVNRVLVQHQLSEASRLGIPRGNLSDLYPRWVGTRELLLHGSDPYSLEVTEKIQAGYYGRKLDSSLPHDPTDQQAFAYPLYTVFLLAPTVALPFSVVRSVFLALLLGLTVASVFFWLRFLDWRTCGSVTVILGLLTVGTFPVVQGVKLQQLTLLVAFLLAASLAVLSAGRPTLAGILLALATIKPHLCLPIATWLLLWSFSKWRERWRLAASFFLSLGVLVGGAEVLLPGWIRQFYVAVLAYRRYATSGPLLDAALPQSVTTLVVLALAIGVALICWKARQCTVGEERFRLTTSLVLAVTLLLLPTYPPYNQLLLLPAILLLAEASRELWMKSLAFRVLLASVFIPLTWSWASAFVLAATSFHTKSAQNFWQLPLWTSVALPVPVVACLGLLTWRQGFYRPLHRVGAEAEL